MKIAIYHTPLNFIGGAERVLDLIVKQLFNLGVDFEIITLSHQVDSFPNINRAFKEGRVKLGATNYLKMLFKHYDCLLITQLRPFKLAISLPLLNLNLPTVVFLQDDKIRRKYSKSLADRVLVETLFRIKRKLIVAGYKELVESLSKTELGKYRSRFRATLLPYDEDFFKPRKDIERDIDILVVGRISPEKRVEVAIELFKTLLDFRSDLNICIFGVVNDVNYYESLKKLVEKLKLENKVMFVVQGWNQLKLREIYNRSRIMWFFSKGMGGIVLIEAIAMGVIPVTTTISYAIIETAKCGKVVRSKREIIDYTLYFYNNYDALSRVCIQNAPRYFSSKAFVKSLLSIFKEAIEFA